MVELLKKIQENRLISVWGMPGVGKSALIKAIYGDKLRTSDHFKRHVWVSVSHPFNPTDFCRSLLVSLRRKSTSSDGKYAKELRAEDLIKKCRDHLRECLCPFIIDGVQSNEDWDWIKSNLIQNRDTGSCIIIITSEESVAKHCAISIDGVYNVKGLDATAADELFKKALEENVRYLEDRQLMQEAAILLPKCGGLPRVIITVARYLSTKARDVFIQELRRLNVNFMHELMSNLEFDSLRDIQAWLHSYLPACPRHLKKCMLYLSIFPPDTIIRRRRLIRRWVAEGYSKGTDSNSLEKYAEKIFHEVAALSIMQPVLLEAGKVIGYRVNGFFREYIMSRPEEERIFFPVEVSALEGHRRLTTEGIGQHLAIGSTWDVDRMWFESLDFSRLRSLTVFNTKWFSTFYVSDRMRVLRVLDLENAPIVYDFHFEDINKLPSRLKFLSLRGQEYITRLPISMGDLFQLQTLDIRETKIARLPAFITKLRKLQYIRAGTTVPWTDYKEGSTPPSSSSRWHTTMASCLPNKFLRRPGEPVDGSRSGGVVVPRGIDRLKALQTLCVVFVNSADWDAILNDILYSLPQLKKLKVSGISRKHGKLSLSYLNARAHLESLSLQSDRNNCFVHWDWVNIPRSLRSLKMIGHVEQLPGYIDDAVNLEKLTLEMTNALLKAEAIQMLGRLPRLCTLRLRVSEDLQHGELRFPSDLFSKLQVLEIACNSKFHVSFGQRAMEKLEHLKFHCLQGSEMQVSGLELPASLKQVWLLGSFDDALKEALQHQLDKHPKVPAPKLEAQRKPALRLEVQSEEAET